MASKIPRMWPCLNLFQIRWPRSKHSKAFKYRIFNFIDSFHGYLDMAGVL